MPYHFDHIDRKIIHILQQKSNTTNLKLSQNIGISPGATLERVRKLEKRGVIQGYTLSLGLERIHLRTQAIIMLSLINVHHITIKNVQQRLEKWHEVFHCYQTLGQWDLFLHVIVPNIDNLQNFLAIKLSTLNEIKNIHTMVLTHTLKKNSILVMPNALD